MNKFAVIMTKEVRVTGTGTPLTTMEDVPVDMKVSP